MIKLVASVAKEMLAPLARRVGTVCAALLVAKGVPADTAGQTIAAVGIAGGLIFDIAVIMIHRRGRDASN
ncbi:hypothetical protein [Flyfo microvirus Tbat2_108]|nr:hypothetical protein [Flyfo microvirus Tbat2_108]